MSRLGFLGWGLGVVWACASCTAAPPVAPDPIEEPEVVAQTVAPQQSVERLEEEVRVRVGDVVAGKRQELAAMQVAQASVVRTNTKLFATMARLRDELDRKKLGVAMAELESLEAEARLLGEQSEQLVADLGAAGERLDTFLAFTATVLDPEVEASGSAGAVLPDELVRRAQLSELEGDVTTLATDVTSAQLARGSDLIITRIGLLSGRLDEMRRRAEGELATAITEAPQERVAAGAQGASAAQPSGQTAAEPTSGTDNSAASKTVSPQPLAGSSSTGGRTTPGVAKASTAPPGEPPQPGGQRLVGDVAELVTSEGTLTLEFFRDVAPRHTDNFKQLARSGFYDGLTFHRIIRGFIAHGGCPLGTGLGGPGYEIDNEFNDRTHMRGTLSMARFGHPDSAGSQFFICLSDRPEMDLKYTVFGQVIRGFDVLDALDDAGSMTGEPARRVEIERVVIRPRQVGDRDTSQRHR